MDCLTYKSYCFCFGTTSFRTKNFNEKIEKQLALLEEFWDFHESENWKRNNIIQIEYYNFLKEKGFVIGDAKRPDKDAREKTSGLADIGLIDENRRLSEVGKDLLRISKNNNYKADNVFNIPKDSYIFLKQMLKTVCKADENKIRPFIVLIYLLSQLDNLSFEEFTYLYPLCINKEKTDFVLSEIRKLRQGKTTVDNIIISVLFSMDNYQKGLELISVNEISKDLFCNIGMNRKSRKNDEDYYLLYQILKKIYLGNQKNNSSIKKLYDIISKLNLKSQWKKYIFSKNSKTELVFNAFDKIKDEDEFKNLFYKVMHLLKARATLSDYFDLNRRYVKTTDIILFEENQVKLDIVPKAYFDSVAEKLYEDAFAESVLLQKNCSLEEINYNLKVSENKIISEINKEYKENIKNLNEIDKILNNKKYERFHKLIENKFSREKLLNLLDMFEKREDDKIYKTVTDNANIPTIFEYVMGIIWYLISDKNGDVLEYMKLSLDADLLPKSHAAGGQADIVYEYEKTDCYPKHDMLLELTLSEGSGQLKMEYEPVQRHLGEHIINTGNNDSYCVFVASDLDDNLVNAFRILKLNGYETKQKTLDSLKIIPMSVSMIKSIINKELNYKYLYQIFDKSYKSDQIKKKWFEELKSMVENGI